MEISSYVLLAVLSVQPLTTTALSYANRIVNWLVVNQNPYGGFFSTQVTLTTKDECNPLYKSGVELHTVLLESL